MVACQSRPAFTQKDIVGAWKTDSIFQYTNGFIEKKAPLTTDETIVYEYGITDRLTMKKGREERNIRYHFVTGDSLVYGSEKDRFLGGYRIISLTPLKLVLRKNQRPMFPGKNQEVYEIRQFSPAPTRH